MRRLAPWVYGFGIAFSLAAGAIAIAPTRAAGDEAAVNLERPATPAAAKAFNVLATYCAGCHQAGRLAGAAPQGDLDNILDLAAIAREPSLVRPGQPDASAIYTRMLQPHPVSAAEHPASHEIEAVRSWIDDLPADRGCADRPVVTADELSRAMAAWLAQVGPEAARDTRFVTIAPLTRACATEAELAGYRTAVADLLQRLSHGRAPPRLDTIEDSLSILTFRLQELGWDAARWEALVAQHPSGSAPPVSADVERATGSALPAVRGDWLAQAYLRRAPHGQSPLATAPETRQDRVAEVAALARFYERAADLERAAAELLSTAAELAARLEAVAGGLQPLAMRLRLGLLPRPELERLLAGLRSGSIARDAEEGDPTRHPPRLELTLWSERARYRPDEIAVFHAEASADCHLTLINVDTAGKATVLFPNEIEPDNLLRAGTAVSIPGAAANYRFRFREAGEETIVGICSATPQPPNGIAHDFALQRFTILGDWRAFLREATSAPRAPKVEGTRRRAGPAAATPAAARAPEPQARTAITLRVE